MSDITHVKNRFSGWLGSEDYLKKRKEDVLFIGLQENLTEAFEKLKALLGIDRDLALPSDPIKAHKSPETEEKNIDVDVRGVLKDWFREDYKMIEYINSNVDIFNF